MKKIGSGTYGKVYRVKKGNKDLALKVMKIDKEEGVTDRQIRELNALKILNHSNILGADIAIVNDKIFITMELKKPFDKIVHNTLPFDRVAVVYTQLLSAVDYMHSQGVAHRDIKPQNIVYSTNKEFKIYLIDFGLATFERYLYPLTSDTVAMDTTAMPIKKTTNVVTSWWRAPELFKKDKNERYDAFAVDMWSVGCVMLECMKRKSLFEETTDSDVKKVIKAFLEKRKETTDLLKFYKDRIRPSYSKHSKINECIMVIDGLLQKEPIKRTTAKELMVKFGKTPSLNKNIEFKQQGTKPISIKKCYFEHENVQLLYKSIYSRVEVPNQVVILDVTKKLLTNYDNDGRNLKEEIKLLTALDFKLIE